MKNFIFLLSIFPAFALSMDRKSTDDPLKPIMLPGITNLLQDPQQPLERKTALLRALPLFPATQEITERTLFDQNKALLFALYARFRQVPLKEPLPSPVTALAFGQEGTVLYAAAANLLYEINLSERIYNFTPTETPIQSLSCNGKVCAADATTLFEMQSFSDVDAKTRIKTSRPLHIKLDRNGHIAVAQSDNVLYLLDLKKPVQKNWLDNVKILGKENKKLFATAVDESEKRLLLGLDNRCIFFDLTDEEKKQVINNIEEGNQIRDVHLHKTGSIGLIQTLQKVAVYSFENKRAKLEASFYDHITVTASSLSPCANLILWANKEGYMNAAHWKTAQKVMSFQAKSIPRSFAWSPDGNSFAIGTDNAIFTSSLQSFSDHITEYMPTSAFITLLLVARDQKNELLKSPYFRELFSRLPRDMQNRITSQWPPPMQQ
jgi:hypothetical protein